MLYYNLFLMFWGGWSIGKTELLLLGSYQKWDQDVSIESYRQENISSLRHLSHPQHFVLPKPSCFKTMLFQCFIFAFSGVLSLLRKYLPSCLWHNFKDKDFCLPSRNLLGQNQIMHIYAYALPEASQKGMRSVKHGEQFFSASVFWLFFLFQEPQKAENFSISWFLNNPMKAVFRSIEAAI